MQIGLIDVDSHNFPNLALMKISAYHKLKGDNVEMCFGLKKYYKVYMSKVFTFTKDYNEYMMADEIIKGGTGYNLISKLPIEIENMFPDYALYNIKDTAYGYLTRGCPRGCNFCIVKDKEGQQSIKVADLKSFWNGQKNIEIMDPNILACKDWKNLLNQLIDSNAYVNLNQGIDIRLMTEEKQKMLNQIKTKRLHFAWDNINDINTFEMLKKFRKGFNLSDRQLLVYCLVNFNSTFEQDLDRVYKLKDNGYDPYIMIYDKVNAPKKIKQMARWVNNKILFRSISNFKDYPQK
jgi:hypothetical protein